VPGARLPTEHEYADLFASASHRSARRSRPCALGLLVRRKGRGDVRPGMRVEAEIELLTSFTDSIRGRGA